MRQKTFLEIIPKWLVTQNYNKNWANCAQITFVDADLLQPLFNLMALSHDRWCAVRLLRSRALYGRWKEISTFYKCQRTRAIVRSYARRLIDSRVAVRAETLAVLCNKYFKPI